MDSISSATLTMMDTPLRRNTSSLSTKAKQGEDRAAIEINGVGLTVPYLIVASVGKGSDIDQSTADVQKVIDDCFAHVEKVFSPFFARSELSLNINGPLNSGAGKWTPISRDMHSVLTLCDTLNELSGGLFDPTAVALGKWYVQECERLGVDSLSNCNDAAVVAELEKRRELVGWKRHIGLKKDPVTGQCYVMKQQAGVTLDPSAASKGWCVDYICEELSRRLYIFDLYIDWGGDIKVLGKHPEGREWCAGVQNPHVDDSADPAATMASVPLTNGSGVALCTSGDYNSVRYLDYHHIVDPMGDAQPMRQGKCASVSVVTYSSCAVADGCATVLLLLQEDQKQKEFVSKFNKQFVDAMAARSADGSSHFEHIHRHVTLFRPDMPPGAPKPKASEFTVLMRFSPLLKGPPKDAPRGRALSVDDAARLRMTLRAVPRSTFIVVASFDPAALEAQQPPQDPSSPLHEEPKGHFACTMTSPVFLKSDTMLGFAMGNSLMGELLKGMLNSNNTNGVWFSFVHLHMSLDDTAAADALGGGGWFSTDHLEQHPVLGVKAGRRVHGTFKTPPFLVGDHIGFVLHHEHEELVKPQLNTIVRVRRSYESIVAPKTAPRSGFLPARVACMATVTRKDPSSGRAFTLATCLHGVDSASQTPLIITAVAANSKLNRKLFIDTTKSDSAAENVPSDAGVRIHFLLEGYDAKALLDWFSDGSAVEMGNQFMYHPVPDLSKLENVADFGVGSGGGTQSVPVVPYIFPPTVTWVDCSILGVHLPLTDASTPTQTVEGAAGPMLLELRPLRTGVGALGQELDKCHLLHSFV